MNIENTSTTQGTIRVGAGKLELAGALPGSLALKADAGTTLVLDKTASAALYKGANATLQLNDAQDYQGTIAGFAAGQTLDLLSIGRATAQPTSAPTSATIGTLTLSDGTHTANPAMIGSYTSANVHAATDGHGGAAVTFVTLA